MVESHQYVSRSLCSRGAAELVGHKAIASPSTESTVPDASTLSCTDLLTLNTVRSKLRPKIHD